MQHNTILVFAKGLEKKAEATVENVVSQSSLMTRAGMLNMLRLVVMCASGSEPAAERE
jgi:hypothetical protein